MCVSLFLFSASIVGLPVNAAQISGLSSHECQVMTKAGVISATAPVPCQRLRKVTFNYRDFAGKVHSNGQLVVMDAVALYVGNIFDALFKQGFPIHKAVPIEMYDGNDTRSMTANNTSAFNYRSVEGSSNLSLHAYGAAIDINPLQNPFVTFGSNGNVKFSPAQGTHYANRAQYRFGKPDSRGMAETVITIFARNGFQYWGGFWNSPIDYQHFQLTKDMALTMSKMTPAQATLFFQRYVAWYDSCSKLYPTAYSHYKFNDYAEYLKHQLSVKSLHTAYSANPQRVMDAIKLQPVRSAICVKR
ncbi:M15 family metallopeptidase [uncultured Photobacterium sp.]|uniref:M15 family metallopeptidase n=1 Tax=uncultured Photobacterium sp. TaxID=173973 RepID=UPI002625311B|nr:M15 family metallopeptidase [uncultured Photobacterium sp.]